MGYESNILKYRHLFFPGLITFFLLASATPRVYGQTGKILFWEKDSVLKWSDFRGQPDPHSAFDAFNRAGDTVLYHWKHINGGYLINFSIHTVFYCDYSWVKAGKETDRLLRHEKIHFDIAEFFKRQILNALNKFKYSENFRDEIDRIQKEGDRERGEMQTLYDNQTAHSRNTAQQVKWEEYVEDILAHDYSLSEALQKEPGT